MDQPVVFRNMVVCQYKLDRHIAEPALGFDAAVAHFFKKSSWAPYYNGKIATFVHTYEEGVSVVFDGFIVKKDGRCGLVRMADIHTPQQIFEPARFAIPAEYISIQPISTVVCSGKTAFANAFICTRKSGKVDLYWVCRNGKIRRIIRAAQEIVPAEKKNEYGYEWSASGIYLAKGDTKITSFYVRKEYHRATFQTPSSFDAFDPKEVWDPGFDKYNIDYACRLALHKADLRANRIEVSALVKIDRLADPKNHVNIVPFFTDDIYMLTKEDCLQA